MERYINSITTSEHISQLNFRTEKISSNQLDLCHEGWHIYICTLFSFMHYSIFTFYRFCKVYRWLGKFSTFFLYFELDSLFIMDFANFSWQSQISSLNVKLHSSYIDLMPGARVKITKLQNNSTEEIDMPALDLVFQRFAIFTCPIFSCIYFISYILQVLLL